MAATLNVEELPVKKMLEGCRKQMAYAMADCQKTVNWMNSIGSEVKQIGNGVSNLGRLLSGKDVKEIRGEKPGIGATRAISGVFKNIMAKLQKNINLVGKALNSLVHRCINPEVNQCLMFASAQGGGRRRCGGIVD